MTSCHLSIFPNLVIFLVFALTARLFECFFSSAWFFASSNITSRSFYPSADHGRLVFRVLQTVLSVGGETPAGSVDGIQGKLSSSPASIFCKERETVKCTQSWQLTNTHRNRRTNTNTPIKSHTTLKEKIQFLATRVGTQVQVNERSWNYVSSTENCWELLI